MNKLFVVILTFFFITMGVALAESPAMNTSRVLPLNLIESGSAFGYCNATDGDGDNVTYNYTWYVEGSSVKTGNTSQVIQGVETLVDTLTSSYFAYTDQVKIGCVASDATNTTTELQSSEITVGPDPDRPIMNEVYVTPTPTTFPWRDNPALPKMGSVVQGWCNTSDDDASLDYYYEWRRGGEWVEGIDKELLATGTVVGLPVGNVNVANYTLDVANVWRTDKIHFYCKAVDTVYNSTDNVINWSSVSSSVLNLPSDDHIETFVTYNKEPEPATTTTDYNNETQHLLVGQCNAEDIENDSMSFHWKWYKNGVEFSSGDSRTWQRETDPPDQIAIHPGGINPNISSVSGTYPYELGFDDNYSTFTQPGSIIDDGVFPETYRFYIQYIKPTYAMMDTLWEWTFGVVADNTTIFSHNITIDYGSVPDSGYSDEENLWGLQSNNLKNIWDGYSTERWQFINQNVLYMELVQDLSNSAPSYPWDSYLSYPTWYNSTNLSNGCTFFEFCGYGGISTSTVAFNMTVNATAGAEKLYEESIWWSIGNAYSNQTANITEINDTELVNDDEWIFGCLPYDGIYNATAWTNSTPVTVSIQVPVVSATTDPSGAVFDSNNITGICTVTNGVPIANYSHRWYVNGSIESSVYEVAENNLTLTNGNYSIGDDLIYSCQGTGLLYDSAWNNASVTVGNELTLESVVITPRPALTSDTLTCNANITYGGTPTVTYEWYRDDIALGVDNITLANTYTSNTDEIICEVFTQGISNNATQNSSTLIIGDFQTPNLLEEDLDEFSGYTDETHYIYANCSDNLSNIEYVRVNFITPNANIVTLSLIPEIGDRFVRPFQFVIEGTYTDFEFVCQDSSGNQNATTAPGLSFLAGPRDTGGGTGGGGDIVIGEDKVPCNIEVSPDSITLTDSKLLQGIEVNNFEDISYSPAIQFKDIESYDSVKDDLQVTNELGTVLAKTKKDFGVRWTSGIFGTSAGNGSAELVLIDSRCEDVSLIIEVDVEGSATTVDFTFGGVFDILGDPVITSIPGFKIWMIFVPLGLLFLFLFIPGKWSANWFVNVFLKIVAWVIIAPLATAIVLVFIRLLFG